VSREAASRKLEVVAARLIRAALSGDEFTIDRIVTRGYEDDLDWRSFANEVTFTGRPRTTLKLQVGRQGVEP
jgi:hypothetical protein